MNLRIPGPTPCPPEVLDAMSRPMINHRGREFADLIQRVTERLKTCFQTSNDLLLLPSSGTGGMEAAVVNTLSPGDCVVSASIGVFGDRFAGIAEAYGAKVVRVGYELGKAADPAALSQVLADHPEAKAVLLTHNETSTGVTNDLKSLAQVCREHGKLTLVDAVSSLGSIPLAVDEWGLDVVVTASQKGWMAPPGVAMVSMSQRAWQAHAEARMPRFYFDLARARDSLKNGQTPWTPVVSVLFALDVALDAMLAEGMDNVFARHQRVGQMTRDGVRDLGLELFADPAYASNTVTCVKAPQGVEVRQLLRLLIDEYNVELAGGQGPLAGKTFRIGHLGWVDEADIQGTLDALKAALPRVGYSPTRASA